MQGRSSVAINVRRLRASTEAIELKEVDGHEDVLPGGLWGPVLKHVSPVLLIQPLAHVPQALLVGRGHELPHSRDLLRRRLATWRELERDKEETRLLRIAHESTALRAQNAPEHHGPCIVLV
jgi:hypothetical protein